MRVAQRIRSSAAAAGLLSLAAACVIPPPGIGPRPEEDRTAAPQAEFYSFDQSPFGVGTGVLAYSVSRDAYTAAFEVDHRGTVRVIAPRAPEVSTAAEAGHSYVVFPQLRAPDREFLNPATDFSRVPYVFILTSDSPLDLAEFADGRTWSRSVQVRAYDPDSVIAEVAQRVLPSAPAYGSDFAYVGPRLRPAERQFAAECARGPQSTHDYAYYRELWAVFTPADQRLSPNPNWLFGPALSWSSYAVLPLASYRAGFAPYAFFAQCAPISGTYQSYASYSAPGLWGRTAYGYGAYGYGAYGYGTFGYGALGYGYGAGGRPIGSGVTAAGGGTTQRVLTGTFHVPRTPLGLATTELAGANTGQGSEAPKTAATARPETPTQFSWERFRNRAPGEIHGQQRGFLSDANGGPLYPVQRRTGEAQPGMGAVAHGGWNGGIALPRENMRRPGETQSYDGGRRPMDYQPRGGGFANGASPMSGSGSASGAASPAAISPRPSSPAPGANAAAAIEARSSVKSGGQQQQQ